MNGKMPCEEDECHSLVPTNEKHGISPHDKLPKELPEVFGGYIKLNEDIQARNYYALLVIQFLSGYLHVISESMFAMILASPEYFDVPRDRIGRTCANVHIFELAYKILLSPITGFLYDFFGRRQMLFCGFFICAMGMILTPMQSTIYPGLIFCRILYCQGQLAIILNPLLADYVHKNSKGKATGLTMMAGSIGCFVATLSQRIMLSYFAIGESYFCISSILLLMAFALSYNVKAGRYFDRSRSEATHEGQGEKIDVLQSLLIGFKLTKNSWILLSFFSAFIAKGESYLTSNVMFLWTRTFYEADDSKQANLRASSLVSIQYGTSLLQSLILTTFLDKLSKKGLLFGFNLCLIIGLASIILIHDPRNDFMIGSMVLMGVGVGGMYVMTYFLIAKYAPEEHRGKAYGALSVVGHVSLVLCSFVGGYLFDIWTKNAQFIIYLGFSVIAITFLIYFVLSGKKKDKEEEQKLL